jgi:hypothetical protein
MTGAGGPVPFPPGSKSRGGRPKTGEAIRPRTRLAEEARSQARAFTQVAEDIDAGRVARVDIASLEGPVIAWDEQETSRYLRLMACGMTPTEMHADEALPRFNTISFNERWLHDSAFRISVRAARSAASLHEMDEALAVARADAIGDMAFEGRRKTLTTVLADRASKHNSADYGQKVAMKLEGEIVHRTPGLRNAGELALQALLETHKVGPLLEGKAEPEEQS